MKHLSILLLIAASSASPSCRIQPDTPLTRAAAQGRVEEVRSLLDMGANPNQEDSHGWAPLHWAARSGDLTCVQLLIDAGADLNLQDGYLNGWTPLMHALHKRQDKAALLLMQGGADVNARSKGGGTALIMAAGDGNLAMVRALLERGADPHAKSSEGVSALTLAVSGGAFSDIDRPLLGECQPEIVRALLEKAPRLSLEDANGTYARFFARLKGCSQVLEMVDRPATTKTAESK